jgi:hypothetical protein
MKVIPKLIGCGIAIAYFTIMLTTSMTHRVIATSDTPVDPSFGPGNPRFEAGMDLLVPDESFPQFDPKILQKKSQETKEYTNVYFKCTQDFVRFTLRQTWKITKE